MFKRFLSLIRSSINSPKGGKESSTRLIAYIITFFISLFCFVFLGIEIYTAITSILSTGKYILSSEIIIVFGSLLTHQLTLLGINKYHETKQNTAENKKEPEIPIEKPVEEPVIVKNEEIVDP